MTSKLGKVGLKHCLTRTTCEQPATREQGDATPEWDERLTTTHDHIGDFKVVVTRQRIGLSGSAHVLRGEGVETTSLGVKVDQLIVVLRNFPQPLCGAEGYDLRKRTGDM